MIVGVPREIYPGERRVALVPAVIPNLKKAGIDVVIEAGAGLAAGYPFIVNAAVYWLSGVPNELPVSEAGYDHAELDGQRGRPGSR